MTTCDLDAMTLFEVVLGHKLCPKCGRQCVAVTEAAEAWEEFVDDSRVA